MYRVRVVAVIAALVVLSTACSSEPLPDVTAESTTSTSQELEVGETPLDGSARSLVGTTWEFVEAFNVEPAYQPSAITFFRVDGVNRIEIVSDCGHALATFVETAGGIRVNEFDPLIESPCWNRDRFLGGELDVEIDQRGQLRLRNGDQVMKFAHVQSTSIQTDDVPDRSAGEVLAHTIGRSRWIVTEATGAAVSEDGLDQIIAFTSTQADADVVSFYTGCRGSSREASWTPDGGVELGDVFTFAVPLVERPPCEDVLQGLARRIASPDLSFEVELSDDIATLSGESTAGPWSATAQREVIASSLPTDCHGFELGDVVNESFDATEVLPDGRSSTVTLDGFEVVGLGGFGGLGGDVDGDGVWNPAESFTLRDLQSGVQVDVLNVCGFDEPIDDFVRLHPNRIVRVGRGLDESTLSIWSSDGERFSQNVHAVVDGPWRVVDGESWELDDPTYLGRVTLTYAPLESERGGDVVVGVLSLRRGCIELIAPIDGALVFPAGRTAWDPVNEEVIVDGERYADGERIGITRLPRPEFLEYYNPMERSSGCGISTHVVSDIWHIE